MKLLVKKVFHDLEKEKDHLPGDVITVNKERGTFIIDTLGDEYVEEYVENDEKEGKTDK